MGDLPHLAGFKLARNDDVFEPAPEKRLLELLVGVDLPDVPKDVALLIMSCIIEQGNVSSCLFLDLFEEVDPRFDFLFRDKTSLNFLMHKTFNSFTSQLNLHNFSYAE